MGRKLDLPAVLAVVVLGGSTLAALATTSCGDDEPACEARCVPDGTGAPNTCPGPDFPCATGPNNDTCPAGCEVEPLV